MSIKGKMLNIEAGRSKFKADELVSALDIWPGAVIADIGSGGGYYSFRFAEKTGAAGQVYAVDSDGKLLAYIRKKAVRQGMPNIQTVLAKDLDGIRAAFDLIFSRNAFHHLEQPVAFFTSVKRLLKPEGRVAIIDYRQARGFLSFHQHHVTEDSIRDTMSQAGYAIDKKHEFLPEQSFTIFKIALNA